MNDDFDDIIYVDYDEAIEPSYIPEDSSFEKNKSSAELRLNAHNIIEELKKSGESINPIFSEKKILVDYKTGRLWCQHLASFEDNAQRLSIGRKYLKNHCVVDFKIEKGKILGKVMGSILYDVEIRIKKIHPLKWQEFKENLDEQSISLTQLQNGQINNLPDDFLINPDWGLFPGNSEISFSCNCLDWAKMCKHTAAVLYGLGIYLDQSPIIIFEILDIDLEEVNLSDWKEKLQNLDELELKKQKNKLESDFGIEIELEDFLI